MSTRTWGWALFLVLALGTALAVATPASAAVLTACTEQAFRDLVTAINNGTSGGDTVVAFAPTTTPCIITITAVSVGDEDSNADGDFDILASMTINGVNANLSIIDGGGVRRCFDVDPAGAGGVTLALNNITVRNCRSTNDGGNQNGGALIATNATVNINNARFTGNTGIFGGAIEDSNSAFTITNSTFDANTATTGDGGAMRLDVTQDTLTNVTVSGNTAGIDGGGILHSSGPLAMNNVTIASNTAAARGGGFFSDGGTSTIQNSIIVQNTAPTNGPDCFAATPLITSQGNNVIGNTLDCNFTAVAGDVVDQPGSVLSALAANGGQTPTHALAAGSLAINNGNNATCAATDQRGISRPQGANCDSGALEQFTSNVVLSGAPITKSGSNVTFNATVANTGAASQLDVYVFVLAPQFSAAFGCAANQGVVFIGPGNTVAPACLTDHPSTFTRNRIAVTVPGGLPSVTVPVATVNAAGVVGTFTGGILLAPPNGLLDGLAFAPPSAAGDVQGVGVSTFTLP